MERSTRGSTRGPCGPEQTLRVTVTSQLELLVTSKKVLPSASVKFALGVWKECYRRQCWYQWRRCESGAVILHDGHMAQGIWWHDMHCWLHFICSYWKGINHLSLKLPASIIIPAPDKHSSQSIFPDLFLDKTSKTINLVIYFILFCTTCFGHPALIACW